MFEDLVSDFLETSGFVKGDLKSEVSFSELHASFRGYCAYRGLPSGTEAALTLCLVRVAGKVGFPSLRVVSGGSVRCSGVQITQNAKLPSNDPIDFLKDTTWCKLHKPPLRYCTASTLRADFYDVYKEWCRSRDVRPEGKQKCYARLREWPYIYFGTTQGGHDVLRGLTLLRTTAPEPVDHEL